MFISPEASVRLEGRSWVPILPYCSEYLACEKLNYGDHYGFFKQWINELARAAVTYLRHGFVKHIAAANSRWAMPQGYDFPESASSSYTSML